MKLRTYFNVAMAKPLTYQKMKAHPCTLSRSLRFLSPTHRLGSGFTLVELAIVILILSLLLLVVFTVVNGIIKVSTTSSPITQTKRQTFFALQTLKSSLDQTYYMSNDKRLWFVGINDGVEGYRKDRLTFSAVHPGAKAIGSSPVREVSYYLRDEGKDTYVLVRREDELVDDEPGKGGAHYELLDNVLSFQMQYSIDSKDWINEWDSRKRKRLPYAIRVKLIIKIGDKEYGFAALSVPGMNVK